MKKVKILFASGMTDAKAKKILDEVKANLKNKDICDAELKYVNVLANSDVSEAEKDCDFAIFAGQNVKTNLKVVNGRNLVYPFLGTDEVYNDIKKMVEEL